MGSRRVQDVVQVEQMHKVAGILVGLITLWGALDAYASDISVASGMAPTVDPKARRTSAQDLSVHAERFVLENGLTVLLSPDPTASEVLVYTSFAAGAIYEPPGKTGLAHFVEHLVFSGTDLDTNYISLLEERGATHLNATTSPKDMVFQTILPPEELPLALWVAAERMGTMPNKIDPKVLSRERKVVLSERALMLLDRSYGQADRIIWATLFPHPHPLHAMVIGKPKDLATVTVEDVRSFAQQYLTPANGVLCIVGNFEKNAAKELVKKMLGDLPPGQKARFPQNLPSAWKEKVLQVKELISRRPRVTLSWRLDDLTEKHSTALKMAAHLMSLYTDGWFGTRVSSQVYDIGSESIYMLGVTLPHDKPIHSAQNEAVALARYVTHVAADAELMQAAYLMEDRSLMFSLDHLVSRAQILLHLEREKISTSRSGEYLGKHWEYLRPTAIQHLAREALRGSPNIVHARPVNPLQPRVREP